MTFLSLAEIVKDLSGNTLNIPMQRLHEADSACPSPTQKTKHLSIEAIEELISSLEPTVDLPKGCGSADYISSIFHKFDMIALGVSALQTEDRGITLPTNAHSLLKYSYLSLTLHAAQHWIDNGIWFDRIGRDISRSTELLFVAGVVNDADISFLISGVNELNYSYDDNQRMADDTNQCQAEKFNAVSSILESFATQERQLALSTASCITLRDLILTGGPVEVKNVCKIAEGRPLPLYVDVPLSQISNCCTILKRSGYPVDRDFQSEMAAFAKELLTYATPRAVADIENFQTHGNSFVSLTHLHSLISGFAGYVRSIGEPLEVPLPFDQFPQIAEWFTMTVKMHAFIHVERLKDAAAAGISLDTGAIAAYLLEGLGSTQRPENLGLVSASVRMAGHAIAAGVKLDPAVLGEAMKWVFRSGASIDHEGLEAIINSNTIDDQVYFDILLHSPWMPGAIFKHLIERMPERSLELLRQREQHINAEQLEELLLALRRTDISTSPLAEDSALFNRIRNLVLSNL